MFSLISLIFYIQLCVAFLLIYGKRKLRNEQSLNTLKTTVVVPYRNEEERILPLLNSINQSIIKHGESNLQFIFIDDHSSDNTAQFILNNLDASFQIFKLVDTKGKKYAIKKGVEQSIFDRILTLDADVSFDEDYLFEITKTKCINLTILPVEMYGVSRLQKLFSVEFWFLQQLTFGCAGFGKYELCNGANLLFTKETFIESLKLRTDANIPSGDDMFLLNAVKQLEWDICANSREELVVRTPSAASFKDLFNQRLRWISKTNDTSGLIGGLLVLCSNLILLFCILQMVCGNYVYVWPVLLKVLSEWISVKPKSKLGILLVHQLYYPFYILVIIYKLIFTSNSDWK
jgi:glycosyltransferase involved in cell wall biosynthesis